MLPSLLLMLLVGSATRGSAEKPPTLPACDMDAPCPPGRVCDAKGRCAVPRLDPAVSCSEDTENDNDDGHAIACPAEAPVCHGLEKVCVATDDVVLGCQSMDWLDVLPEPARRVGRHKATSMGRMADRWVAVKTPLDLTERGRRMFVRHQAEEIAALVRLGPSPHVPRYYGACLQRGPLVPAAAFEYVPHCFPDDAASQPFCLRLLLAHTVGVLLAKLEALLLCDFKAEQFCLDGRLRTAKLVDVNQVHLLDSPSSLVSSSGRVFAGTACLGSRESPTSPPVCRAKCFAAFRRQFEGRAVLDTAVGTRASLMEEDMCVAGPPAGPVCPGYDRQSMLLVYCHTFVGPLLNASWVNETPGARAILRSAFAACTAPRRADRGKLEFVLAVLTTVASQWAQDNSAPGSAGDEFKGCRNEVRRYLARPLPMAAPVRAPTRPKSSVCAGEGRDPVARHVFAVAALGGVAATTLLYALFARAVKRAVPAGTSI